jgi:hypothetical protein
MCNKKAKKMRILFMQGYSENEKLLPLFDLKTVRFPLFLLLGVLRKKTTVVIGTRIIVY